MNRVLLKGANGEYEPHFMTSDFARKWFKEHTDKKGNVTEEIVLFNQCEVKADKEVFTFVLTDYTADRDKERIDPDGWDFKEYKNNPIVLWAHDTSRPAIGTVSGLQRKALKQEGEKAITGKVTFDEDDEFALLIKNKVKNGFLSKGSVGFRSKKVEVLEEPDKDGVWLIHREQELYEFSVVNVPSNPNSTVLQIEPDETKQAEPKPAAVPDLVKRLDALEAEFTQFREKIEGYIDTKDSTVYEEIFEEAYRETSDAEKGSETSDLNYLFSDEDEFDTIENILTGADK